MFGLLVFVHEAGHFFVAKATGVKVNEFALGMGPKILKFQKGETVYALRLFPIGGFCAMEGEEAGSEDDRSYCKKKVWQRALICVAGATLNLVLGFVLSVILVVQQPYYGSTTIVRFEGDNTPTQQSGLQVGDKIIAVNGNPVVNYSDYSFSVLRDGDETVEMTVKRNGEKKKINVTFDYTEENGQKIFVQDFYIKRVEKNFFTVIDQSAKQVVTYVKLVWFSLLDMVTGKISVNEMSGPIGVTNVIGESISVGESIREKVNSLINIVTLITINLGVFNLLPLPALDGGKLFFLLIETVRRKPIKPEYEGYVHMVGFGLLLLLMVFVSFNDIVRLIKG